MTHYFVIAQLILFGFNFSFLTEGGVEPNTFPNANIGKSTVTNLCRCRDSLILVALYNTTNGPNWKEGWDLNEPLEEWAGVNLDNGDCVAGLTLNGNNLVGELTEDIGNLAALKQIALGNNLLNGNLPTSLGDLKNLESLNFRNNQFTGLIPIEVGKLSKLNTLNLSVNQLSGTIPDEIGNIRALTGLFLNQNNLTGQIPTLIGNLSELVSLNFSLNNLDGAIPSELGNLLNIVGIGLNGNSFSGILPERLGQLNKLVSLRLENNELSGPIPEAYGNLSQLETIFLFNNKLSGCFPESFKNLCDLIDNTSQSGRGYNFRNNPLLPWKGDFAQFCSGESQLGATCDDGSTTTPIDGINSDCTCKKMEEIVEEVIEISIDIATKGTCIEEELGYASIRVFPTNEKYQIEWLLSDGSQNIDTTTNATFERNELAFGMHSITISDITGKLVPMTALITIEGLTCLDEEKIPQLITPNGDGLNERFIFETLENNPNRFPDNELIIFNRWGNIVYKAAPYQNTWSGNNQNGENLPEGTYYYVFKLDLNEGLIIKGDITIIR